MFSLRPTDNDLPKYIVKLILNQNPIDSIRSDLSLFLDANNTPFVDWLEVYLQEKRQRSSEMHRKPEVIAANEIEEDILDFEEQNDMAYQSEDNNDQERARLNSSSDDSVSNKRKLDQLDDDPEQSNETSHKVLLNNSKEPVKLNQKHGVINLRENKHLNDIGLMRRQAIEENKAKGHAGPVVQQSNADDEQPDEEFSDLREKLDRKYKAKEVRLELEAIEEGADEKKEKCKFWPFCKKEDECIYHHPTKHCDKFPSCELTADKCPDIHPMCKFDVNCNKMDCPFLHIAKRQLQIPAPAISHHHMSVECKYYPKCYNANCPFFHPKLCLYGALCKKPGCMFKHPEISSNVAKPHQCKFVAKNLISNR